MDPRIYWTGLAGLALTSFALTALVRRYALSKALLDVPNARSSHAAATPRGGGLAIVLTLLVGGVVLCTVESAPWHLCVALLGAGSLVALVGWLDDLGHVAARWRLVAHSLAAIWALYWLGEVPVVGVFGLELGRGWIWQGVAIVYVIWLVNLYNFMDGIDGIAGIEAVTVAIGIVIVILVSGRGVESAPSSFAAILAASALGFLVWNFPKAWIFMGDVGSGFLGMTFGVLSLQAGLISAELFWSCLILLGVFVVDATWTLWRRLLRGDRIHEAHRSHAYQHAARRLGHHFGVSSAVGALNLIWLLPIACLAAVGAMEGIVLLGVAYAPLCALAWYFDAGVPEVVP
jgi:Fuc2NAc and GlcNAc transferase